MADAVSAGVAAVTLAIVLVRELKELLAASRDMTSTHDCMNRAMALLVAIAKDRDRIIRRHATKMPSETYNIWVASVGKIEAEVKILATRYIGKVKTNRFFNAIPRSNFTEKMRKKGLEILDLWEKGNQLIGDGLFAEKDVERVVKIVGAPEIQRYPTLQKPLDDILGLLANNQIKGIEVHGGVGCGKTTIMQNLNNHHRVDQMFDVVIWVKVSAEDKKKNSSTEYLQKVISDRLKLDMDGVDRVDDVANTLRERLKENKYLILLDDVKEDLNLDQLGIPLRDDMKVGSKIVLATTILKPLFTNHSLVDRRIEVHKLGDVEAMDMFQTILGRPDLSNNQHIKRVMHKVAKLGDGVPLMIKMIVRCFIKRETEQEWEDGFKNLRYWPRKGDKPLQELYDVLNFCYDNLNDAQKEDCFLYSALYPEDGEIYVGGLVDGWWAENLLDSGGDATDMHAKAREILRHLKEMLFLEVGMNKEYVRMQKWIRRAALYTMETSDNHNHLVRTSEALKDPPEREHWMDKKWISLADNHLHTLPKIPKCSVLSTLFLQENLHLKKIPDNFFHFMTTLRVLGLHGTGIASLPPSLSKLINLKVLNLNGCTELVEFPSQVVKLQNLEVLDIRGIGLNNIPPEIESLARLRRLLASFTSIIGTNTQAEVISKISTLKELIFDVRFSKEMWDERLNDDVLRNLIALKKLTNLQVRIQDEDFDVITKMADDTFKISAPKADHLNSFVRTRDEFEYTSFQLFVGCSITADPQICEFFEYPMYVKYCNGEGSNISGIELLPKEGALEIVSHKNLERLSMFGAPELSKIRGCLIQSCSKVKTILDGESTLILSNLEHLYLNDLPELLSIWDGAAIYLQGLPNLITLDMRKCPKLTEIFPQGAGEDQVTQATDNGVRQRSCVFPMLKEFILDDMPQLTSVYRNDWLAWPSLEKVWITKCPELSGTVPFNNENAIKLTTGLKIE